MSLENYEDSRSKGEPVELYLFIYGPNVTDYYAYTTAETAIVRTETINGSSETVSYEKAPLQRDGTKSTGTLDKTAMNVKAGSSIEAAELFRIYPPSQEVALYIRQGHIGDPDNQFLVCWAGRVLGCKWMGTQVQFTCEPIATSMRRTGLRRHWQYGCPHALYRGDSTGGCRASKAAATTATTAAAVSGNTVTLPSGWNGSFAKEKFRGGMAEWTNASGATETRTILRVDTTNDIITLSGLARDLAVDDAIDVILGCNHQMTDCKDLHNVLNDFGGDPWIPTKNPYGNTNNYY